MAKDPAFLFYSDDFLAGTYTMTDAQAGQYIRLLCLQHQQGHLAEAQIVKLCKKRDAAIFGKFTQDEDGLYFNVRLEKEAQKRNAYCESRRKNKTSKNEAVSPTYDITHDPSYDNHMSLHMGNGNIYVNNKTSEELKEKDNSKDSKETNGLDKTSHARTRENDIFLGRSFSAKMQDAVKDWLRYKSERRDSYKPTGLKNLLSQVENQLNKIGEEQVILAISESMACNYRGIIWDKAKSRNAGLPQKSSNGSFADAIERGEL